MTIFRDRVFEENEDLIHVRRELKLAKIYGLKENKEDTFFHHFGWKEKVVLHNSSAQNLV